MIISYLQGYLVIGAVLILQWKSLKKESRSTRWMAYGFLMVSALIWSYCTGASVVERPMVWFEKWLHPLNPFL